MFTGQNRVLVQHSFLILTRDRLQELLLMEGSMTFQLGPSVYFLIAKLMYSTLQGWEIFLQLVFLSSSRFCTTCNWSKAPLLSLKISIQIMIQVVAPTIQHRMAWVGKFSWKSFSEQTNSLDDESFVKNGLVEQLSQTWDKSDYLWYTTMWVEVCHN